MKKNIVIGLLLTTTLLSLMYGFVQKAEADKQRFLAEENARKATLLQVEVEQQVKMLQDQRDRLEVTLKEIQESKEYALRSLK